MKLSDFRKQQRAKRRAQKRERQPKQTALSALAIPPKTTDPMSLIIFGCPVHPLELELSEAMDNRDSALVNQLRSQLDKELQTQFQKENQMVKLSKYTGGKFLKAKDCDPPLLLTIASSEVVELGKDKEEKIALYFEEGDKGLVLNMVNADTIEQIAGTDDTDDMGGVKIVAFKDQTDYAGRRVDCIRVRAPKKRQDRKPKKPSPPKDDEFSEAVDDDELDELDF